MKQELKYTHVFLDADDTLFDYAAAEQFALKETCLSLGIDYDEEVLSTYREINGRLWRLKELGEIKTEELRVLRFEKLFDALGSGHTGISVVAADGYIGFLTRAGFLIDNALEVCRELKTMGVRLAIVTNGIKDVQLGRLSKSGLEEFIDHIVISDEVGFAKPARELFDYAFSLCGITEKRSVLMVGDSLTADIRGGISYGIDTCWYNPGFLAVPEDTVPDFIISDLTELPKLVRV